LSFTCSGLMRLLECVVHCTEPFCCFVFQVCTNELLCSWLVWYTAFSGLWLVLKFLELKASSLMLWNLQICLKNLQTENKYSTSTNNNRYDIVLNVQKGPNCWRCSRTHEICKDTVKLQTEAIPHKCRSQTVWGQGNLC